MVEILKSFQKIVDIIVWFGLAFLALMLLATLAWSFQKIPTVRHFFCLGIAKIDSFLGNVADTEY